MGIFIIYTKSFVFREDGATVVEYGLLIALIAIVTLAVLYEMGVKLNDILFKIGISILTRAPF